MKLWPSRTREAATPPSDDSLADAVRSLEDAVRQTSDLLHPWKRLGMAFGRGLFYGAGLLVAVAVLVPLAVALLSSVDWVPIIGDFLAELSARIEEAPTLR